MYATILGFVLVMYSLGTVDTFQNSRVDERLDLLEENVYYELRTVREDLQRIFGLLNTSVTYSSSSSQDTQRSCHNNHCSIELARSFKSELDDSMTVIKRVFADEKTWMRSHAQELQDAVSRVKRDLQVNDQRVKESFENLEGKVTQICTAIQTLAESVTDKLQTLEKLAIANSKDVNDMKAKNHAVLKKLRRLSDQLQTLVARIDNDIETNRVILMEMDQKLLLIATMVMISLPPQRNIFDHVYKFGASMYVLGSQDMSWSAAMKNCDTLLAHLPYVESKEENEFLADLGRKINRDNYGIWLGAKDDGHEGIWMWEPINRDLALGGFVNWLEGQPDDNRTGEDCLSILSPKAEWNDVMCDISLSYLCEIEVINDVNLFSIRW